VITEGTLDCISVMEVLRGTPYQDLFWAISIQGTNLSCPRPDRHLLNSQLGKIKSLNPSLVLVLLDPEERSKAAAMVALITSYGLMARHAVYPVGADPNKIFQDTPEKLLNVLLQASRSEIRT